MRTTLDIDEDVLVAAKELARVRNTTAGHVISDLARQSLIRRLDTELTRRNGFWVLPKRGGVVTNEFVAQLLDEED